jgi:hypothetical protein
MVGKSRTTHLGNEQSEPAVERLAVARELRRIVDGTLGLDASVKRGIDAVTVLLRARDSDLGSGGRSGRSSQTEGCKDSCQSSGGVGSLLSRWLRRRRRRRSGSVVLSAVSVGVVLALLRRVVAVRIPGRPASWEHSHALAIRIGILAAVFPLESP